MICARKPFLIEHALYHKPKRRFSMVGIRSLLSHRYLRCMGEFTGNCPRVLLEYINTIATL